MQKFEDVAIPMQKNSNMVMFCGTEDTLNTIREVPTLSPFSEEVIIYLDHVAKLLLKEPRVKQYPDVLTFAFWCRKSSIIKMAELYCSSTPRLGKGVTFHIAPSNVPVNFAYSLAVGILAGNVSIVRVPSKEFEQIEIIVKALKSAFDTYPQIRNRIILVRYDHDRAVTEALSSLCDVRIIWGGDHTIAAIRTVPMPPRATEIVFADRYSFSIIDADAYLALETPERIAQEFYNDTYLNDQNACTSPQLIVWLGTKQKEAQDLFWTTLHELILKKYDLKSVQTVGKLSATCRLAMNYDVSVIPSPDNYIVRIQVDTLFSELMAYKYHSGFFLEYSAQKMEEILPMCTEKCQTISYCGISSNSVLSCIMKCGQKGVDRIVPLGRTMDFAFIWDGYDLIECLTRTISVR